MATAMEEQLRVALERAERDAQRWERVAVAAEALANASNERRREAEAQVVAYSERVREVGRDLVTGLDDLAGRVAEALGVPLPERCCPEDDGR